jgi:multiple sugar transport system permease protein
MTGRNAKTFWLILAVAVALLWTFLPMYWVVKYAFMTKTEIARFPPMLYPPEPILASFFNIFGFDHTTAEGTVFKASGQARQIILGLRNSLIVALVVTAITTLVVVPLSYVFARLQFPFKGKLLAAILLSVSLPPVSTLIPFYTLYVQLGLTGTLFGLIIVTLTITIPIVAWMLIGFFRNLPPVELLARVDGFSRLYTLTRIIVPMARSGILVAAVIAFLFSWNEYVYAQILVTGSNAVTLPAAMSGFLFQVPEPAQLAASLLLSLLPPFCIAFFLQKHIAEMHIA